LFAKNSIVDLPFETLISRDADVMYIEAQTIKGDTLSIAYDKTLGKKKYMLE